MRKFISIAAFLVATSLFAEVSVFDAGNINKENPYGLTENEKVMLNNKQKVDRLNQNVGTMQSDVTQVQENIEGVKSLLDSINKKILNLETRVTELENSLKAKDATISRDISSLKAKIKESKAEQDANYNKITVALKELTTLIDGGAKNLDANQTKATPKPKAESSGETAKFDDEKPATILAQADESFKAKEYLKASERYEYLVKKQYKPAYSNFMLAEIKYTNQEYKNAIPYYQKSVKISQKGEYMPKLLYHTAISYDKIGDTKSANKFYKALKQAYPDSAEAKALPNRK